ncbi:MAG: hypothetical protein ACD_17C00254G0002 [uncultured bacterium]|nr:MAG: hypothetical protein ACD_17C00254G0002 [uncultured bacterium]OGN55638.1 MAG: hypothetical protein A2796_00485 [Chlamydiae bacterium RIFCSPHIGHO2_01_FULL_44_39]OGN59242.1 MAG: hypothetical protein A3C42_03940 [Chlamydiae bacterium RIFCSPHIGHO2_02_FULL_45_9]OGN60430.1 MAG: hypothetical protein A3D96_00910 [Chlamydiae bacterium RIFCSPHIGHO2_12_FULL_44_59]OGN66551.1 MAG: hypothetical protein A2978_05095 [Chlamydiae bacterium RIFCSPLOWO2_01_FULL_44_52]OGN69800.1 MAG: hypothetical protein A3
MTRIIALFGEAEKGAFSTPHRFQKLPQLVDALGNPPGDSEGLFFAIQAILYNRNVIFFRVEEEGYSPADYYNGLRYLENKERVSEINALCLPGVGDPNILKASEGICYIHKSLLITNQRDLYDFLTSQ